MGSQWDRKPAWVETLPYEEEPEQPEPDDGFGPGPRHASVLSGNEVSYVGKAGEMFWMHPSLGRAERVIMLTQMAAYGPTRTMDLCAISGMSHKKIGATLRGLAFAGLITSRVVPGRRHGEKSRRPNPLAPFPDPLAALAGKGETEGCGRGGQASVNTAGGRRGHPAREWDITEEGRRWLWRLGWVTRCAVRAPCDPIPWREDVPRDPVKAVRSCVHRMWLRPNGLTVIFYLRSGWRPLSLNRLCRVARINPGIAQPLLKRLVAGRLVAAHPTMTSLDAAGVRRPMWQISTIGEVTFLCHVDAIRRAALSTGWRPDPDDPAYDTMRNARGEYFIAWEPGAAAWGWEI